MAITGIVAEFNPLHNGHKRLIDEAKSSGDTVAAVISGNFVQRGECAVTEKGLRTRFALKCGVDIVAELPVLWSMSTAENFALGGVWQLYSLGCKNIIFGSESGDIDKLISVTDILCSDKFSDIVSEFTKSGVTFASARQSAAEELGADVSALKNPNDNLGIEYIIAAKKLGLDMDFRCLKREGAAHDSRCISGDFVSSSYIREQLIKGNIAFAERFMPGCLHGMIDEKDIANTKTLENAILSVLRTKTTKDFENLPDVSEGLNNRLHFAVRAAKNLDELQAGIKSKRYTLARVRRLILSAFLGFDNTFFMKSPPYVRILGASKKGIDAISQNTERTITKASQIKDLSEDAKKVFSVECKATDIYTLAIKEPLEAGLEFKRKFLKSTDF